MSLIPTDSDKVIINGLCITATVGPDRWGETCPQLITLTTCVETSFAEAYESDDVNGSINYMDLTEGFEHITNGATFVNLLELAKAIAAYALSKDERILAVEVDAYARNQFLQAEHLGVHIRRARNGVTETEARNDLTKISNLSLTTIIGAAEREAKQNVLLNLEFIGFDWSQSSWEEIHATLVDAVESTSSLTLEALVIEVARVACNIDGGNIVTVKAQQPGVAHMGQSSGVQITRAKSSFTS